LAILKTKCIGGKRVKGTDSKSLARGGPKV